MAATVNCWGLVEWLAPQTRRRISAARVQLCGPYTTFTREDTCVFQQDTGLAHTSVSCANSELDDCFQLRVTFRFVDASNLKPPVQMHFAA